MMNQQKTYFINFPLAILSIFMVLILSCEEGVVEVNPFETITLNQDTVSFEIADIDPNTIAGIYQNVFAPTCANSGCHDGAFEPDFRTLESSYYSMVNQIAIKTDGTVTYRVEPGNATKSSITKRLEGAITPDMPIIIEPDSDWPEKGDEYIENVKKWINDGALDVAGNSPSMSFLPPSIIGAGIEIDGEWIIREDGYEALIIPSNTQLVDLYLAFDETNSPENFTNNKISFFTESNGDVSDTTLAVSILPVALENRSIYGNLVSYTHHVQFNISGTLDTLQSQWFFRATVKDQSNPIIEIPTDNGINYIKEYMSFRWND